MSEVEHKSEKELERIRWNEKIESWRYRYGRNTTEVVETSNAMRFL
jgi:hypothetical protein